MQAYWFVDFYTLDWGREKIEEFLDTCQVPHLAGDFLQFLFHLPRIVYPFFHHIQNDWSFSFSAAAAQCCQQCNM
jgi:hypothetical protein